MKEDKQKFKPFSIEIEAIKKSKSEFKPIVIDFVDTPSINNETAYFYGPTVRAK